MGALDQLYRYGQPAATMLTGAVAEPLAGLAGLFSGNADNVGKVRDALTYQPSTPQGQQGLQAFGSVMDDLKKTFVDNNPPVRMAVDAYQGLTDAAGDYSPALGAAFKALPTAASLVMGPGSSVTRKAIGNVAGDTMAAAQAVAPQIAKNAMAPRTMNPQAGAIVWHGSPHKFDAFDASKIGTGEGAQVYGNGLYLAESQDVAKGYANANMGRAKALDGFLDGLPSGAQTDAYNLLQSKVRGPVGDARLAALQTDLNPAQFQQLKQMYSGGDSSLYKVDLPDEHIAKMMNWDKSLDSQSNEVYGTFRKAYQDKLLDAPSNSSAGAMMVQLQQRMGAKEASEYLRSAGIPGVRYLDGGSRTAGAGSSNYVVFPGNEGLLSILERNGQALK